jgi:RHS repeat-associated protein
LKVYPGDQVDIEVWEYHEGASGFGTTSTPLTTLITMVSGAFGGYSGGIGEPSMIYNGVNSALTAVGNPGNQGSDRPAAYLNYILFDVNYNVLDAGAQVAPATTFTKQKLSFNTLNIKEEGHLFVYLSYDNDSNNWVYFDDFKITHNRSNVIQYNEYYPFGMQTAKSCQPAGAPKTEIFGAEVGTRDGSKNDYLYNAGNEMNSNTGWYETFFRGYDATLGKFLQTDPMADKYGSWTPYNYAFNDPVYWNDPNGADPYTTSAREYYESVVERDGYQDGSVGMYGYSWNMATYGSASAAGGATSNGGFGYGYHGHWEKYESGGYYENRPNSLQPENLVWKPTYSYRFIADTQNNGRDRRGYIAAVSRLNEMGGVQYSWEEALGVGRERQGDPGKGWFTKFGELFEKNYNGGVTYDGDAWYGTNFIGPGPTADPYKLRDPKNPGQYLKPKDMVDAAAQRHDYYYYKLGADGLTGALFNTDVTFADHILAYQAYQAFTGYFKGNIDPVTGNAISPRTRDVAFDILVSFGLIGGAKSKFP